MANDASATRRKSHRLTFSCIRCAERKVKCDREKPCSACAKHHVDCIYNTDKLPRDRRKRVKVQSLVDRINQCEALLQEHGITPGMLPDTSNLQTSSRSSDANAINQASRGPQTLPTPEAEREQTRSSLFPVTKNSHSKFIENSLWKRVIEESHESEYVSDDSITSSDLEASDDDYSFVLNVQPKAKPIHPPQEIIEQLWDIFADNVDPLTKIVHVPTLRPAVRTAITKLDAVSRSFDSLLFAIYGAAIMSLRDDECQRRFAEGRKGMLLRYISATEAALSRAKFMGTTNLIVLQALVLHLLSVRDIYEPRAVWTLTGVAVRIAQGMGIERDGTFLGLSPFETEIRRRVWWQLKLNDFRTAELCGLAKFRDLDDSPERTQWPTNMNDGDLYPDMPSIISDSKITDAVFIVFRCEWASFATARIAKFRRQGKGPSQWNLDMQDSRNEIEDAIRELEEKLETQYLRYCDPSQPLQLLTMLIGRYAMNVTAFLTHHPRTWANMEETPSSERQYVWDISIKLLEQHCMVLSNPLLRQFAWHSAYFQQWHAFIHVLDTLRANPLHTDGNKAWQLIGTTYENTPNMIKDLKKPIHAAVGSLCLKAFDARESMLRKRNTSLPPAPNFVLQLRQQREAAQKRRQARSEKGSQSTSSLEYTVHRNRSTNTSQAHDTHMGETTASLSSEQSVIPNQPGSHDFNNSINKGPFHDLFNEETCGPPDMDFNFMLPKDQGIENCTLEPIDWTQWDTWLTDSNLMRSS